MPTVEYPYIADGSKGGYTISLQIEGAWNKEINKVDPTSHEIPLSITLEANRPDDPNSANGYRYTFMCESVKLTDYAIQHDHVDLDSILGLSVEHLIGFAQDSEEAPQQQQNYGVCHDADLDPATYQIVSNTGLNMGALSTDSEFKVNSGHFQCVHCYGDGLNGSYENATDGATLPESSQLIGQMIGVQTCSGNPVYGNWNRNVQIIWNTELPVFDTDAHLLAYIRSGGRDTTGLLNGEQAVIVDPQEEDAYDYYINNIYTLYTGYGLSYQTATKKNIRLKIKMKKRGRVIGGLLALVNDPPYTPEDRYPRKYHLIGDDIAQVVIETTAGIVEYSGDIWSDIFYRTSAGKAGGNYCKVERWSTNIPFKDGSGSLTWAQGFLTTGNPAGATNIKKIIPKDTPITPGTSVDDTPIPKPGFTISSGGRILGLTSGQVNTFFTKIFDDTNIQALLDGTQLFGSSQIGAIKDLFYIPCSVTDIATCSTTQHIFLGSYDLDMGTSVNWVTNNNKLIDCGTVTYNETFGSYLDYEPFCLLYLWLPFCGVHRLQVSKYINKTVHLRYGVSVFDGSCVAFLSTNNGTKDIVLDTFTGNMAVHRPLTANDQQRQTAAVAQGIMQTSVQAIGTVGTVAGAGVIGQAAKVGGIEAGIMAGVGQGVTKGLPGAGGAIASGANTLQAAMDAPMTTRGTAGGMLSLFDTMIPTFIVARLNSIEPVNEVELVGKPSNVGGLVSSFSGYLKTSAFDMDNFPGTLDEAQEIQNLFRGGVYID